MAQEKLQIFFIKELYDVLFETKCFTINQMANFIAESMENDEFVSLYSNNICLSLSSYPDYKPETHGLKLLEILKGTIYYKIKGITEHSKILGL